MDAASRRQKWIDQAQSLNLYIANASGKKLEVTYQMAWLRGLKTTYYLRALGATSTEKSTIETPGSSLNAVTADAMTGNPVAGAPTRYRGRRPRARSRRSGGRAGGLFDRRSGLRGVSIGRRAIK